MRTLFDKNKVLIAFTAFIACTIQIQLTFFETENYAGIRLNVTDLILPIAGLFIFFSLILNQSQWPQFQIKHTYLWLALLSAILLFSFLHGYFRYSELNQWALVNKTAGWFILCSYFLMGAWIAQNTKNTSFFFLFLIKSFVVIALGSLALYILTKANILAPYAFLEGPFSGLMGNKNAFIFLLSVALCLSIIWKASFKRVHLFLILVSLIPTIFVLSGSRMLIITSVVSVFLVFIFRLKLPVSKILIALIIGLLVIPLFKINLPYFDRVVMTYSIEYSKPATEIQGENYTINNSYHGDRIRLQILDTTISMIKNQPIIGHGLASAHYEQEKQWGEPINIIDCTPLWLWAETGIFGLFGFLFFYWLCLQRGWKMSQSNDKTAKKIGQSLICLLVLFSVMSLLHEILYTRFLWFIMGLCLVYPTIHSAKK